MGLAQLVHHDEHKGHDEHDGAGVVCGARQGDALKTTADLRPAEGGEGLASVVSFVNPSCPL